jgi:hypothetical protein
MTKNGLKIVAGTTTIIGIILSVLNKTYAPHYLLLASSPDFPECLRTAAWLTPLIASFFYIALDLPCLSKLFKSKNNIKANNTQPPKPS